MATRALVNKAETICRAGRRASIFEGTPEMTGKTPSDSASNLVLGAASVHSTAANTVSIQGGVDALVSPELDPLAMAARLQWLSSEQNLLYRPNPTDGEIGSSALSSVGGPGVIDQQSSDTAFSGSAGINATPDAGTELVQSFAGPTDNGWIPPDPSIASGPTSLVVTVNDEVAWYDKSGTLQNLQGLESFFGYSGSSHLFDPRVTYDQYSGHFYAIADLMDPSSQISRIYVAESNTSDPTQGWSSVSFGSLLSAGFTNYWADYPTLAVDQYGLYITANYFSFNDPDPDAPLPAGAAGGSSSRLFMLPKDIKSYYTYDPAASVGLDGLTLQPAHTYESQSASGLSGSFLVAYLQNFGNDTLCVCRVNNAISGSTTFSETAMNVGDISDTSLGLNMAAQLGSTTGIDVGPDDRIYDAVWRDGILYATTEISLSNRAVVHWFEVNTSTMRLIDQGNVTADDLGPATSTYYGNIAVNSAGDFAIGFAASNPSIYAGAYYALHRAGDPSGTMEGTQVLHTGQNSYVDFGSGGGDRNRWGDYSGISVDPANDTSFWVFNEYASSAQDNWNTQIGSVTVTSTTNGTITDTGFDEAYYLAHNPDVAAAGVDPYQHYLTYGWKEGRDPSAYFSTVGYLDANPDVKQAQVDPLLHYHTFGWKEGRDPSTDFDTSFYLVHRPDVAAAQMDPVEHYLKYGISEHAPVLPAVGSSISQQDFDPEFYKMSFDDVAKAGVDPFWHYDTFGWHEGRNPNALFDTDYYLSQNPDVAVAGMDPLVHYEQYGWKEGRNPSPLFNTNEYLAANPDVAAAHIDPLHHFLAYGLYEGRLP